MDTTGQIPPKSPRTETVSIRLPANQAAILRGIAKENQCTITNVISDAIAQYVEHMRPNICTRCNTINQIDSKFCKNCGLPLNKEGLDELDSVKKLVRKNPSLLYQLAQDLENK